MKILKNRYILLLISFLISSYFINFNRVNALNSSTVYSKQHPILFLHGWTGDSTNWNQMKGRFINDGWSSSELYAYTFNNTADYSNEGNIQNANEIKQWVDNILNGIGAEKVDLVCHSMGGISSRYYIKFLGGLNKVDDYVCMGSPHHGVAGGTKVFNSSSTFLNSINDGDETPGGILNDTIGSRVDPIGGSIYNSTHVPGNINYTSIYSTGDTICAPYITSKLEGANSIKVEGVGHVNLIFFYNIYDLVKDAVYDGITVNNEGGVSISGYDLLLTSSIILIAIIIWIKTRIRIKKV